MTDLSFLDPLARRPDQDAAEAIDRAHLRRMTLEDPALEREVLALFERQAGHLTEVMAGLPAQDVAATAHRLKGSATGVGAFPVARAAEALELAATPSERAAALSRLADAVAEAKSAIGALLRAH